MRRTWYAAVVVLLPFLAVGQPASSAVPPPREPARTVQAEWRVDDGRLRRHDARAAMDRLERLARSGQATADAVRSAYHEVVAAGLRDAGRPYVGGPSAGTNGPVAAAIDVAVEAGPAGDFDGDRVDDVVEVETSESGNVPASTVRARRGLDGKPLWDKTFTGWAYAIPARLGPDGRDGVIALVYTEIGADAPLPAVYVGAFAITVDLIGLDHAGQQLWSQKYTGVVAYAFPAGLGGVTLPVVIEVYDAAPGKAEDVLVLEENFEYAVVTFATENTLVLVNGDTGAQTPVGAPAANAWPYPVPDMSGDQLGDIVWVSPELMSAHRVVDGVPLWVSRLPVDDWSWVSAVGDVTGDDLGDLAVTSYEFAPDDDLTAFLLVSGADGKEMWRGAGDLPYRLGDVNRDGRIDVGSAAVLDGLFEDGELGFHFFAYAHDGRRLYRTNQIVPVPGSGFAGLGLALPGDVQPDKVNDLRYAAFSGSFNGRTTTNAGVINGRTGKPLHRRIVGDPAGLAIDGRGNDFVEYYVPRRGVVHVRAQQGSTGALLWETTFRHPGVHSYGRTYTGQLTRDRCGDVLVSIPYGRDQSTSTYFVLDGGSGQLRWARMLRDGEDIPIRGLTPGPDRNPAC